MKLNISKKLRSDMLIALRFAIAVTIAMLIHKFFRLSHGYWIPMTVIILYLGGGQQGIIVTRLNARILGTAIGLIFGYLYVRIFMYQDYRWGYAFPVAGVLMLIFSKNLVMMYVFITVLVVLMLCVVFPEGSRFNLRDTLLARMINTGLAGVIVMVMELALFRKAGQVVPDLREKTRDILNDLRGALVVIVEDYSKRRRPSLKKLNSNYSVFAKFFELDQLFTTRRNEFDYDEEYDKIYKEIFREMTRICRALNNMLCVLIHPGEKAPDHNEIGIIREAGKDLSNSLKKIAERMRADVFTRPEQVGIRIKNMLNQMEAVRNKLIPDLYFTEGLTEIASAVDKLDAVFVSVRRMRTGKDKK